MRSTCRKASAEAAAPGKRPSFSSTARARRLSDTGFRSTVSSRGMVNVDLSCRITFASTLRDVLLNAETPASGATGMVEPEPGGLKRLARTGKRRLFGRTTPYWLRRGIDVLQRVRHAARRGRRHSDQEAIP